MMQEERLRALGQMASGIAHDINNALSPVSLYAESMLETERDLSDLARDYLETMIETDGHAAVKETSRATPVRSISVTTLAIDVPCSIMMASLL